jgi:2-polyprenyl-3-methyl-5-hydroxy-6-metoxy-1,4-benzoquinol methylase
MQPYLLLHLALALQWKPLQPAMLNLKQRSYKKELLDAKNIPFVDIKQNMKELNSINTLLGGHKITILGIKAFVKEKNKNLSVCEIGCGGGDNLNAISKWTTRKNIDIHFTGIDIKKECIDFAKEQYPTLNADWIASDYSKANLKNPDIIFSSLFCHHFTEEELIQMLQWMQKHCSKGFFINDLHRNTIAYYSIKWLTGIFSKSYLVKNDAPLSVARGFTKAEWQNIFARAGIKNYSIKWQWAFRHLIIYKK